MHVNKTEKYQQSALSEIKRLGKNVLVNKILEMAAVCGATKKKNFFLFTENNKIYTESLSLVSREIVMIFIYIRHT